MPGSRRLFFWASVTCPILLFFYFWHGWSEFLPVSRHATRLSPPSVTAPVPPKAPRSPVPVAPPPVPPPARPPQAPPPPSSSVNEGPALLILSWTSFFGDYTHMLPDLRQIGCPVWNCKVTADKSTLGSADAVMFHFFDVDITKLPEYKPAGQLSVSDESTLDLQFIWHKVAVKLRT